MSEMGTNGMRVTRHLLALSSFTLFVGRSWSVPARFLLTVHLPFTSDSRPKGVGRKGVGGGERHERRLSIILFLVTFRRLACLSLLTHLSIPAGGRSEGEATVRSGDRALRPASGGER